MQMVDRQARRGAPARYSPRRLLQWARKTAGGMLAAVTRRLPPARLAGRAPLQSTPRAARQSLVDRTDLVRAFLKAVQAEYPDATVHSEATARFAGQIARVLGLPDVEVHRIECAAMLHDVGKIAVPREILEKPGPLTPEEWSIVHRHPVESARLVAAVPHFHDLVSAIRHHHEAWDGSGYPEGLKGTAIPLAARILAVADAWDAMTSDRPYRRALDPDEAVRRLLEARGRQFDPAVVDAFMLVMGYGRPAPATGGKEETGPLTGQPGPTPMPLPRRGAGAPGPAAPTAGRDRLVQNARRLLSVGTSGGAGQTGG